MTWLSQSFYQCSQKQIVCEKSFSSQDSRVAGGRTHSPAFPYIALERALCSGKHQGQPTAGLALRLSTQRLPAWEDGAAAATSSSNNKQQPWNVNENWPIPNPRLLDVSCLACIFWVQQIQASDWLPFPSCSLMSICIIHKKKRDVQFHEGRCHSSPGAYGKYYGEDNFYIICMFIKCIFLFSTEGLGIQQREWTLLICLCQSTMAENTRNGNQKSHRERKIQMCAKQSYCTLTQSCSTVHAQFCACIWKGTQRFIVQRGM